jgi:hypothetical protein
MTKNPRYFAPISPEELEEKVKAAADDHGDFSLSALREALDKDLKVEFDGENFTRRKADFGPKSLIGIKQLVYPGGEKLTFWGMCAGGDWESPVFWICYWDGKKVRAYVPTEGNPWNTDTKQAYGNDGRKDFANCKKRWPDQVGEVQNIEDFDPHFDFVPDQIEGDIRARLQPKQKDKR